MSAPGPGDGRLPPLGEISGAKQSIRARVWERMERRGAARFPGAVGRIPNFVGSEAAARRLASLAEWDAARTVKCNPDSPQLPVRAAALSAGKMLFVAVPRLAADKPFLRLDPERLEVLPRRAVSIAHAARHGKPTSADEVGHLDLVVCGVVAVNPQGVRIGKGGGFSDLELALLVEAGLVDDATVIATTVHEVQVLEEELPETEHDFRVDLVVTPERVIRTGTRKRTPGVIWEHLDAEKIAEVPVLRVLSEQRRAQPPV
ncbi:MAG: 5-formyltetrahydrofolate cyclo-ligase [Chloroflexota bacterium]